MKEETNAGQSGSVEPNFDSSPTHDGGLAWIQPAAKSFLPAVLIARLVAWDEKYPPHSVFDEVTGTVAENELQQIIEESKAWLLINGNPLVAPPTGIIQAEQKSGGYYVEPAFVKALEEKQ